MKSILTKKGIIRYLHEISKELEKRKIQGEIILFGGAVMTVAFDARKSTKDVDTVFRPPKVIREIAAKIARDYELPESWLNDGVKGFVSSNGSYDLFFEDANLKVFTATPEYILAMKCMSLRLGESTDEDDIVFLVKKLQLTSPQQVFKIVEKYYPRNQIPPKTQYAIEELFETKIR